MTGIRLVAASRAIREAVPQAGVHLAGAVTALGDPEFLVGLLAVLFWVHRRRETASVVGVAFVALVATVALKAAFGLPRPPPTVRPLPVTPGSPGFPSGHATAATAVYGGLAARYGCLDDPGRAAGVVALVGAIALSRVVLGVHYLGDVLAGVALGLLLLGLLPAARRWPVVGFLAAFAVSVPAVALFDLGADGTLALAGSLGGAIGVRRVEDLPALGSRREGALLVVVGLAFVVAMRALAAAAPSTPVVFAADLVLVYGVFRMPAAVGALPDRWHST